MWPYMVHSRSRASSGKVGAKVSLTAMDPSIKESASTCVGNVSSLDAEDPASCVESFLEQQSPLQTVHVVVHAASHTVCKCILGIASLFPCWLGREEVEGAAVRPKRESRFWSVVGYDSCRYK